MDILLTLLYVAATLGVIVVSFLPFVLLVCTLNWLDRDKYKLY